VRFLGIILFAASLFACEKKDAPFSRHGPIEPPAYWVWHRGSALTGAEKIQLHQAGTRRLFWQVVECEWLDQSWKPVRIAAQVEEIDGISITPVFRIKPKSDFLGPSDAAGKFARLVQLWANEKPLKEIQIDFDCPDRLIENYANFLSEIADRLKPTKISITALASWPKHPHFKKLARTVSSMSPMFYDLHRDKPVDVLANRFQPMANAKDMELIRTWKNCPVPWFAGLPNFERISIFDSSGNLTGHVRGWSHDEWFFHPALTGSSLGNGVTFYKSKSAEVISGTQISTASQIIHRFPDLTILDSFAKAADESGATGLIYFALPGPGMQAAFSPSHLAQRSFPKLKLRRNENGSIVLENTGLADLPANPETGGWQLVLESETIGTFQSGSPGSFPRLSVPGNTPPEFASKVVLHFSKLSTGSSIVSGSRITASDKFRWSILNVTEPVSVQPQ